MELALGAMASLAPKLGDLLMEEYVVQKGLKPDIESLSLELLAVNAALVDASRVPPDQLTAMDKLWARQVRELSYDMEDAVDGFVLRVAGCESTTAADANIFKKMVSKATGMVKKVKHRHQISDKVKDIKKLSNELAELRAKYTVRGAGANLAASTGIDPRVLNLYMKDSDLVGIEESRDKVIRMLTGTKCNAHSSDDGLKIVSIVGVGGLGKTTLAKTVHDKLKKDFSCSAFISVGRTPDMRTTFAKMLMELDKSQYNRVDMARWDVDQFCKELHGFLQHKRYFIVVDDIWDKESWESIKYALKDNYCGSKILMTTRNFEVVMKVEEVYRLKPLSDGNSEKLFYKRIQSQDGERIDDVSSEVSSKIIDRCGGVPLAIIAIASLLADRPREEWSNVYDSIGLVNEDNTKKIMAYSYYDLPSYLKPCLLHLGIFPEDCILDAQSVIWIWIGEGFVHAEKEEDSLFEVGERYLKELLNRCMVEPTVEPFNRFTQCFRIHDIVLDLIRELLRSENFFTILGNRKQHASSCSSLKRETSGSNLRRLAVQNHNVQHISEDVVTRPEVLRSFNVLYSEIENIAPLDRLKVCRVVLIRESSVPISLFKHLGRLLYLKYLNISYTHVDELPKGIENLKCLQALALIDTGLHELPPAVCTLTQLMCLVAIGFQRLPTGRVGNLTSLEDLQLHSVVGRRATEEILVELGKLTRLRVVSITFSVELEESLQNELVQSLRNLHELQELDLSSEDSKLGGTIWEGWEPSRKLRRLLIEGIRFWRLPRWINGSCTPRLCFLSLNVYSVETQGLDNLARLPELVHLELKGCTWPPGYNVGTGDFKNLGCCRVGTTLKFHVGAMPRLEELQFRVFLGYESFDVNGVLLEQFPTKDIVGNLDFGIGNLLSLEQVTVHVDCFGATAADVEGVEAVVRRAVEDHPNHPTIELNRVHEEHMLDDERQEALLQQHIELRIPVLEWKDKPDAAFISLLRMYQRLQEAVFSINCAGASMCEVEKVEAAFSHAAEAHRNHPTIQLIRTNTDKIISSDHSDTELDDRDDSVDDSLSKLQLRN